MNCFGKQKTRHIIVFTITSFLVDGYFGDTHDCNVYHVCVDGRDYRSNCAYGLAWEPLLRLCMPTHLVNCQSSKSIDSSIGTDGIFCF